MSNAADLFRGLQSGRNYVGAVSLYDDEDEVELLPDNAAVTSSVDVALPPRPPSLHNPPLVRGIRHETTPPRSTRASSNVAVAPASPTSRSSVPVAMHTSLAPPPPPSSTRLHRMLSSGLKASDADTIFAALSRANIRSTRQLIGLSSRQLVRCMSLSLHPLPIC